MTNVTLTSSSGFANIIQGQQCVGGIGGAIKSVQARILNCTVTNTFVNATCKGGGVFGAVEVQTMFLNCYNLGFPSNPSAPIVQCTGRACGGLIGWVQYSIINASGVESGTVSGSSEVGAVVGYINCSAGMDSIYARPAVTLVSTNSTDCGGLIGTVFVGSSFQLSNSYSRASLNCSNT